MSRLPLHIKHHVWRAILTLAPHPGPELMQERVKEVLSRCILSVNFVRSYRASIRVEIKDDLFSETPRKSIRSYIYQAMHPDTPNKGHK